MSPAGDRRTLGQGPSGTELLGLAVLLAAAVVVPLVIGIVIDSAAHTAPVFLFIGLFLGVIGAAATIYSRFRRYM
jgi:F0F1-type ATP synthase assembly protein I